MPCGEFLPFSMEKLTARKLFMSKRAAAECGVWGTGNEKSHLLLPQIKKRIGNFCDMEDGFD